MHSSSRYLKPVRRAGEEIQEYVRERPRQGIAGILLIGVLVALGIWAWPEIHRTVHIHRM